MVVLLICSATFLISSCKKKNEVASIDTEKLITQKSDSLTLVYSVDGKLSYRFQTPLLERFELAKEPYMEFREGVRVETYNDSTKMLESELTADYAIFFESRQLWEAKGNVVGRNNKGQVLETQQLYWDQRTKKIYSPVESKITQGEDVIYGEGFESDETMSDFVFRRPKGRISVENIGDTTATSITTPPQTQPSITK